MKGDSNILSKSTKFKLNSITCSWPLNDECFYADLFVAMSWFIPQHVQKFLFISEVLVLVLVLVLPVLKKLHHGLYRNGPENLLCETQCSARIPPFQNDTNIQLENFSKQKY